MNAEIFDTLLEARVLVERWRWEYNQVRLRSALGYGITFGPRGYEVAAGSPLKGKRVLVGLKFMGKVVDETE